jgi:hypothetical protein
MGYFITTSKTHFFFFPVRASLFLSVFVYSGGDEERKTANGKHKGRYLWWGKPYEEQERVNEKGEIWMKDSHNSGFIEQYRAV